MPFSGDLLSEDALETRAKSPPVNETGFEGIAYVTLPIKAELGAPQQMGGELGCIDFIAHKRTTSQGKHDARVRLPLANTLFQTGELSTLVRSSWSKESNASGFQRRARKSLKAAVIRLSSEDPKKPDAPQTYSPQDVPALSIPLVPLTFPRRVDEHMGNIIRGVIGPDGEKMTASTELEQVVPQYFRARNEPAQATSAWALVIPRKRSRMAVNSTSRLVLSAANTGGESPEEGPEKPEAEVSQEAWEQFWQRDPPLWNNSIQKALAFGARLHKVLSGGGGWGKKAGLLSLDPVPFGAPQPSKHSNGNVADASGNVHDFSTALNPVVQDGDWIQFFTSPAAPQVEAASTFEHLKSLENRSAEHVWTWQFGVVPSTVDSIPGGSWQHTTAAKEEMAVLRGSFGALTEGSLTLMHGVSLHDEPKVTRNEMTTAIDVPFSRWSAIRLFPKKELQTRRAGSRNFFRPDLMSNPKAGDPL